MTEAAHNGIGVSAGVAPALFARRSAVRTSVPTMSAVGTPGRRETRPSEVACRPGMVLPRKGQHMRDRAGQAERGRIGAAFSDPPNRPSAEPGPIPVEAPHGPCTEDGCGRAISNATCRTICVRRTSAIDREANELLAATDSASAPITIRACTGDVSRHITSTLWGPSIELDRGIAILRAVTIDLTTHIRSGDTVLVGQGAGEPRTLVELLIEQRHDLGPLTVFVGGTGSGLLQPEHADVLHFVGYGAIGRTAALSRAGVLDVIPAHLGSLAALFTSRTIPIDVVLCQVSPGDDGRHSLGLVADYLPAAIATARTTIAEVHPHVPYTFGATVDANAERIVAVPDDRPLLAVQRRELSATDRAIADHVAALVPDGATIQFGVGGTPDAVLTAFSDKRDLGVHSGLISDALLDLVEAGAVTNARKPLDVGLTVTGAIVGTERLYRWAHRNPTLLMRPVSYTHDPRVLAAFDTFHAINAAIEVDLGGQINAETLDGTYIGAVGGHGAFARAGAAAVHGRSIITLASTAAGGTISRIVARLCDAVVSTPRADADLVVTEHGVADLRGATLRQRAERLIAIADPAHRDELRRARAGG